MKKYGIILGGRDENKKGHLDTIKEALEDFLPYLDGFKSPEFINTSVVYVADYETKIIDVLKTKDGKTVDGVYCQGKTIEEIVASL
jgi:hypothetical protein